MQSVDYALYDLLDHSIFVLQADESGHPRYQFLNKSGLGYLGKELADIVGKTANEIFDGRAAQSVFRRQCAAWVAGTSTRYEIALPIGEDTVWVRTSLTAVHDADGVLTHMVGMSQDITAEREHHQTLAMTAAAAREMEDLVCMAAHDLRSPIGNLKSLADVLRVDFVDHGDGKYQLIDMIDAIADKALLVVSDIMVQAMATNAPVRREVFDLSDVCDDILVLLDPMRGHSVSCPSMRIEADYTIVHIILRNLVDNAIKHVGGGPSRIEIDCVQMNAQRLMFSVKDNGPGLSDSKVLPTKSEDDGQNAGGFGLLGIRRLAEARGGTISIAKPEGGSGALIQFELPGRLVSQNLKVRAVG